LWFHRFGLIIESRNIAPDLRALRESTFLVGCFKCRANRARK
jgi:hypothetical protein